MTMPVAGVQMDHTARGRWIGSKDYNTREIFYDAGCINGEI